jgi:hypothetical protein
VKENGEEEPCKKNPLEVIKTLKKEEELCLKRKNVFKEKMCLRKDTIFIFIFMF